METILFLAWTEADGTLAKTSLEALERARDLASGIAGASLVAGLIGSQVQPAADSIANCGAARVLAVTGPEFAPARYATDAGAAEAICAAAGATIVIAPAGSRPARVLPGVAYRLHGRADTHVTGVALENGLAVRRWYYRQRIEAELARSERPWILLLEAGCDCSPTAAARLPERAVTLETLTLAPPPLRTTVTGARTPEGGQQTIRPDAALLFVAGAGWTKKQADGQTHSAEAERLILDFLRISQASLGGSKSLVDLSAEGETVLRFMTHLNQVGQTGSTPRHPKGLSTCCHGEEPHVVGWRFITERRAVNLDPNCGWARGKADVLYLADAFAVMAKVNALIASA